jgi:hypothetical protein
MTGLWRHTHSVAEFSMTPKMQNIESNEDQFKL